MSRRTYCSSCLTGRMLGWHVGVYTLVAGDAPGAAAPQDQSSTRGLSLTQMDGLRDRFAQGDRIAVWQAGIAGLRWVDELVETVRDRGALERLSVGLYEGTGCGAATERAARGSAGLGFRP